MIYLGYVLALLIGISLGLLGGGGSILTVPVLVYVMGIDMKQAVPMSLIIVGLTSLYGVRQHALTRNVQARAVVAFGPAAIVGSLAGSAIGLRLGTRVQLTVFALVMLSAAVAMLRGRRQPPPAEPRASRPLPVLAAIGAGVGVLTGAVGVGGGFLYVPALALLGGLDMHHAVGTSLALIALSCAAGLAGYAGHVQIDWPLVAVFVVLAFVGVRVGAALVPRVPQATLRRGFAIFILIMGTLVLIRR